MKLAKKSCCSSSPRRKSYLITIKAAHDDRLKRNELLRSSAQISASFVAHCDKISDDWSKVRGVGNPR